MPIVDITDEVGNVDRCEVEPAPSTRIVRVIERIKTARPSETESRTYQAGYMYACGYRD